MQVVDELNYVCLRYVFKNNIYARLDVWLLASQQYSKWVGEPD